MTYRGISLFSGCGGLDLGFDRYDSILNSKNNKDKTFEIVWANDIETKACKSYAENFGFEVYENAEEDKVNNKIFNGDVRNINFSTIFNSKNIDFITGGFPCQDFSMLRGKESKRQGIKSKRGKLYLQFVRALVELQPKIFIAENVKGLKSANQGTAFQQIIDDFQNLNDNWSSIRVEIDSKVNKPDVLQDYQMVFADIVNFADYGVPQNRKRLIFIGIRKDLADQLNANSLQQIKDDLIETVEEALEKKVETKPKEEPKKKEKKRKEKEERKD